MLPEIVSGPRFAPKAILLLTAKLERPMWRYRDDPRSFRVVLHDAGHVLEQVKLVARALGLVAYVASGLAERELGRWLGLDDDECMLDYVLIA
jgi:nitroreductase